MNARAVAAWSAASIFIDLFTTNPAYKGLVLAAGVGTLAVGAGLERMRGLLFGLLFISLSATLLNFVSAHLGDTVLFRLPDAVPAIGGPYTLEALVYGCVGGITIAAAVVAAAAFSLLLASHDVIDALPAALSRTGTAIAASLNLIPSVAASFAEVSEAQRLRGWKPRGPRSWSELVVPVVLTTVEGAIQLAESMEARAYGRGQRTSARSRRWSRSDWLIVAFSALAIGLFLISRILAPVADWYPYPTLAWPSIDVRSLAACLCLFAPVAAWRSRD